MIKNNIFKAMLLLCVFMAGTYVQAQETVYNNWKKTAAGREIVPIDGTVVTGIDEILVREPIGDNCVCDPQGLEVKGTPHPGINIINVKKVIIK